VKASNEEVMGEMTGATEDRDREHAVPVRSKEYNHKGPLLKKR
jgi:hypothetical protein